MDLDKKDFYGAAVAALVSSASTAVYRDDDGKITKIVLSDESETKPTQSKIDAKAQELLDAHKASITDKENLKASAKAKLIAGEALTEDEANILTGI
tara:strand:+ start:656 stop:946 length:291 start_codon:yes stop_codon:yes gene_type:complete